MKCKKCQGCGWIRNPKWVGGGSASDGITPSRTCKTCQGTGFVVGDMKDVISQLKYVAATLLAINQKELSNDIQECIKIITEK